jgi:hypothetical protein
MALLFADSFDHYATLPGKWDTLNSYGVTPAIQAGAGRNGTAGFVVPGYTTGNTTPNALQKNLGQQSSLYIGFALNVNYATFTAGSRDLILAKFVDGSTTQVDLRMTQTGNFYFTRSGTQIGAVTIQSYPGSAWHYMEIGVTISSSAGVVILRVDGTNWINLTNQNTQANSDAFATGVAIGWQDPGIGGSTVGKPQLNFDDVYICNGLAPAPNGFLGNTYIGCILPSGNGTTQQWSPGGAAWPQSTSVTLGQKIVDPNGYIQQVTAAGTTGSTQPAFNSTVGGVTTDGSVTWTNQGRSPFQFVSENPPNDGQTFITNSVVGNEELFTFPSVTQQGTIAAVVIWPRASGNAALRGIALSGSTTGDNGSDLTLTGGYTYAMAPLLTDPNTGVAWTIAGLNAAQFGVKQTG